MQPSEGEHGGGKKRQSSGLVPATEKTIQTPPEFKKDENSQGRKPGGPKSRRTTKVNNN